MPRQLQKINKPRPTNPSRATPALQPSNTPLSEIVPALLAWFCAHARDLPWRRTRDPYAIWVSEIMLQQTQVKTVIPYWERWMRELPTIEALANAPSEKIHKLWEGLGYYTRVRNMQKAAQLIVQQLDGKFPTNHGDVLQLPGIGRYTAGAICSIAFNQPTPIVDGNVIRVLARVFGIDGDPKDKTVNPIFWNTAEALVAEAKTKCCGRPAGRRGGGINHKTASTLASDLPACSFLNQSLMELGALICTPREPNCAVCPIRQFCVAHRDDRIAELPALAKRAETTHRNFVALVVERDNRYLVRQRPAGVVNAHLWEFPNFQVALRPAGLAKFISPFEVGKGSKPICQFSHSITRYRNQLQAFRACLPAAAQAKEIGQWLTLEELQCLAFSSAHKKILQHLVNC